MFADPLQWTATGAVLGGVLYFAGLYLSFGLISALLTRVLLPGLRIGHVLDPRPLETGQVARELRDSALSIVIFGVGVLVPWGMVKLGWAAVVIDAPWWRVALECIALLLWNDVHFYANHRLLHHPRLFRRFHWPHHRSIVTTPWSTYAFHPLEALLLGSVLILPMLAWNFSVAALLALPALSLIYNSLGHANYQALPTSLRWLSNARDHHLHHACFRGNYGFLFKFMDRWLGTELAPNAADAVIQAGLKQQQAQQHVS